MHAVPTKSTVEAGDSFEHWHQVTCRDYSVSEFHRCSDNPFHGRISSRAFGALMLSEASSTMGAARLIRGLNEIRKDPRDHLMLFLVTEGEISVAQHGREARAQAGDLFLYDQSRPLALEFQRRYQTIMLNIPRPLLESRVPRARALTAYRIAGSSKIGALAGTIIRQLDGFDAGTEIDIVNRVAASTLDIVAIALEAEAVGDALTRSGRHRLLVQVQTYLLAHLQNTRLDINTIANATNTTPRTLNRMFAAEGTTPMRWLWQQRLAASNRALAEGHSRSVMDASLSFGFSDVSHFSRSFKMTFGKPPGTLKRR